MKTVKHVFWILSLLTSCNQINENDLPIFSTERKDSIINNCKLSIKPILLDSFNAESNDFKIYSNYSTVSGLPVGSVKAFESLIITKNGRLAGKIFLQNLNKIIKSDNFGILRETYSIELIKINNCKTPTYSIVFIPHMSSASYYLYSFFSINRDRTITTDSIFGMSSKWFDSKIIDSKDGSFEINLNNSMFSYKFPVVLKELNDKLEFTYDASAIQIDNGFMVLNANIGDLIDRIDVSDSIQLYPDLNSKEQDVITVPLKDLGNFQSSKAAIEFDEDMNIYQILTRMKDGMSITIEQYNSGVDNYNTKWCMEIKSDSVKGWIRKIKDYQKLGFMMYE